MEKRIKKRLSIQVKAAIYSAIVVIIFSVATIGFIVHTERMRIRKSIISITGAISTPIRGSFLEMMRVRRNTEIANRLIYLLSYDIKRNKRKIDWFKEVLDELNIKARSLKESFFLEMKNYEKYLISKEDAYIDSIGIVGIGRKKKLFYHFTTEEFSRKKSKRYIDLLNRDVAVKGILGLIFGKGKIYYRLVKEWEKYISVAMPLFYKEYTNYEPLKKYEMVLTKGVSVDKKINKEFIKYAREYEPPIGKLYIPYLLGRDELDKIYRMFLLAYDFSFYRRNVSEVHRRISQLFFGYKFKTDGEYIKLMSAITGFCRIIRRFRVKRKDIYYRTYPYRYVRSVYINLNQRRISCKDYLYLVFRKYMKRFGILGRIDINEMRRELLKREFVAILLVRADKEKIADIINREIYRFIDIAISVFIRLVFISYVLGYFLSRRIKLLESAAIEVGKGNLEVNLPVKARDEISVLTAAFNDMVSGLRRARKEHEEKIRMEEELKTAETIQKALLPSKLPRLKGVDIAGFYSAYTETSGDYYDFIPIKDGRYLLVVMADVSNHGVPSGLVMIMARTVVHTFAESRYLPKDMFEVLNRRIYLDTTPYFFISMFYGFLDIGKRLMIYGSAGHMEGLVYRAKEGVVEKIPAGGIPVGVMDNDFFMQSLAVSQVSFSKGDMFLQYTDGIVEGVNEAGEEFGMVRLMNAFRDAATMRLSAKETIDFIIKRFEDFVGSMRQSDDITISIIRFI